MLDLVVSRVLGELQSSIETEARKLGSAGLSVAVLLGNRLVWKWSHGFADLERSIPVTDQTAYKVASVAKCFVAAAVMQLYEEGAFRLDDPVTSALPWFRMRGYDPDDPIRIRHLLSHTAGLPADPPFPIWTTQMDPTQEDLMRALPEQDVIFSPGLKTKYSNLGYSLLEYSIESISRCVSQKVDLRSAGDDARGDRVRG